MDTPLKNEADDAPHGGINITTSVDEAVGSVSGNDTAHGSQDEPYENDNDLMTQSFTYLISSDDEDTIAQEEALEPEMGVDEELQLLSKDMGVSLEELLAYSGKRRTRKPVPPAPEKPSQDPAVPVVTVLCSDTSSLGASSRDTPSSSLERTGVDQSSGDMPSIIREASSISPERRAESSSPTGMPMTSADLTPDSILSQSDPSKVVLIFQSSSSDSEEPEETSELAEFYFNSFLNNAPIPGHIYSEVEDEEYLCPVLKIRKTQVGDEHQAEVQEAIVQSPEDEPQGDELLWKPSENFSDDDLVEYTKEAFKILQQVESHNQNESADHPLALQCLLEAHHDSQTALALLQDKVQESNQKLCEEKIKNAEKCKLKILCDEKTVEKQSVETKRKLKKKGADKTQDDEKTNKYKKDKKQDRGPARKKPK